MTLKIYACAMLAVILVTLVGRVWMRVRRPKSVSNWDLWEAAFNLVLLPALIGYAWRRPFLDRILWQAIVPLAWAAFLYSPFSPTHRKLARDKGMRVAVSASLVSAIVNFPGMLAITLYAYSAPGIWK